MLLLLGGAGVVAFVPLVTGKTLAIVMPDEIASGAAAKIRCEIVDNAGNHAHDEAPQIAVYEISTGTRTATVALTTMTQVGATNVWEYSWTSPTPGTYEITVAGKQATVVFFGTLPITVRPRFDPIALGVDGVLVSRM